MNVNDEKLLSKVGFKPLRKNGERVKKVFERTMENVKAGEKPNVSGSMRLEGYSPSSCRALKVQDTATWKQLLDSIPENVLIGELFELATDPEDKRTKLEAIKEFFRLKDKYPASKMKLGAFQEQASEFIE